jgi:hypothetical protein
MTDELKWARAEVRSVFPETPFISAWVFEESSASPEAPADICLQHVRDSDLVILLVGGDTSDAVRQEVHEAIASEIPLLAFLFPADERSRDAQALVEEVGREATWKGVTSRNAFRRELNRAIEDVLIQGVRCVDRAQRGARRTSVLEGMSRASMSRCASRWLAVGVPQQLATQMATDPSIGERPGISAEVAGQPLSILAGELGAGKSLCAERFLQRAIAEAASSRSSPLPAFAKADDLQRPLEDWSLAACEELGDPRRRGIFLVLDGLDELGGARAHKLLVDARELTAKWPGSIAVLTSRSIPVIKDAPECVAIPELTSEDLLELLGRVRGAEVTDAFLHTLPTQLQASIRRPLFAILLGIWLAQHDRVPASRGELLAFVAESAVTAHGASTCKLEPALRNLAVQLLTCGEQTVPKAEIATGTLLESLLDTGLVVERAGRVSFPLALLMHWFACEGLKSGVPQPTALLQNREALERWREPLAILLGSGGFDQASRYLQELVREVPGFAASIVSKALSQWGQADDPAMGDPLDCARRIRWAFSGWKEGLQELGDRVTPTEAGGSLLPLAITTARDHRHFTAAWYSGPADRPEVFSLQPDERVFEHGTGWEMAFTNQVRREPAWPWRLALEHIVPEIDSLLGRYGLVVPDGPLVDEAVWYAACRLMDKNPLRGRPIALESVPDLAGARAEALLGSPLAPQVTVQQFRDAIRDLRVAGSEELLPPWPVPDFPFPDRGHDWIWNFYSPERMRDRLNVVVRMGLVAYMQIVRRWFPRVRQHMATAVTCPARAEGQIYHRPGSTELKGCPRGFWYLRPIGGNGEIQSDIQLVTARLQWSYGADQEIYEELLRYRPHAAEWIPFTRRGIGSDLLHEYPVARFAYQLLMDDLGRLGLADAHSPRLL